ncbi:MAG: hypothetical protein ACFFDT_33920 [Candidatus Hodarchaeota archaeon]
MFELTIAIITNINQLSFDEATHIFSGLLTGLLLILVGFITLSRNKNNRVNQAFLGFFSGLGLHFCLDSILFIFQELPIESLNLLRDLSILFLILGLSIGALATIIIHYGEGSIINPRVLIPWTLGTIFIAFLGVINDSLKSGDHHADAHFEYNRSLLGWIGITGIAIVFTILIVYNLLILIRDSEKDFRLRLLKMISGFILIIVLTVAFDTGSAIEILEVLTENLIIHLSMHLGIIFGSILILNAFWTPLTE